MAKSLSSSVTSTRFQEFVIVSWIILMLWLDQPFSRVNTHCRTKKQIRINPYLKKQKKSLMISATAVGALFRIILNCFERRLIPSFTIHRAKSRRSIFLRHSITSSGSMPSSSQSTLRRASIISTTSSHTATEMSMRCIYIRNLNLLAIRSWIPSALKEQMLMVGWVSWRCNTQIYPRFVT